MGALDKFHNKAMEVAFFADQERRRGNEKQAAELFEQALDLELKALAEITEPVEPTYSIYTAVLVGWLWTVINHAWLSNWLAKPLLENLIRKSLRNCAICWRKPTHGCTANPEVPL